MRLITECIKHVIYGWTLRGGQRTVPAKNWLLRHNVLKRLLVESLFAPPPPTPNNSGMTLHMCMTKHHIHYRLCVSVRSITTEARCDRTFYEVVE